jgi:malate/lactate dehydrogenase
MPRFVVTVREIHTQKYEVDAEDEEEAIHEVANGGAEIVDQTLEYSHMSEPDGCKACGIAAWKVEKKS